MLVIEKYKEEIRNHNIDEPIYCHLARLTTNQEYSELCYREGLRCEECRKISLLKLSEEYKEPIKLTPYELQTLRLLFNRGYLYITKEGDDDYVMFHNTKIVFENGIARSNDDEECSLNDTFNFIEKETIYKIKDILDNYEVVDYE